MARFSAWLPLPSRRLGSFALSFAGDAWDCVGDYSVADFEADYPGEDFVDGPAEDFEGDPVVDFVYGPAAGFACALPVGCGHGDRYDPFDLRGLFDRFDHLTEVASSHV